MGRAARRTTYEPKKAHIRLYAETSRGRTLNLTEGEMREIREYVEHHLLNPGLYPLLRFCANVNISRTVLRTVRARMKRYEPPFSSRPIDNPRRNWEYHNRQRPCPDHVEACKKYRKKPKILVDPVHPDLPDPAAKAPSTADPTKMTPELAYEEMGRLTSLPEPTGYEVTRMEMLRQYIQAGHKVSAGDSLGPPPPQTPRQVKARLLRLLDCVGPEIWLEVFEEYRDPQATG